MKVALLIDSLGFGGAQRQIVNLAVELKALGHDISVVRYHKDDFYLPFLQKAGIELITVATDGVFSRLLQIRKVIRSIAPDVVISFMGTPNFCASVASIGRRSWKLIISERVAKNSNFQSPKARIMKKVQALCADAIVCNSKAARDMWAHYYPGTASKLAIIYNIIDVPALQGQPIQDGKCRILIAARYEPVKNLQGLLQAILLLSDEERKKLELHWYGNENVVVGGESVLLSGKRFVTENGLTDTVFLHPATDQIYSHMVESDFVALFSHAEGLPNAIIEGMSLRKPVIMSRVSDYDVLVSPDNGFCCDPASTEDISRVLRNAIHSTPEQRRIMGQYSWDKVKKVCAHDAVVAKWNDLISTLCSQVRK